MILAVFLYVQRPSTQQYSTVVPPASTDTVQTHPIIQNSDEEVKAVFTGETQYCKSNSKVMKDKNRMKQAVSIKTRKIRRCPNVIP